MTQTAQEIEKRDYLLKRVGPDKFTRIDPDVFYDPVVLSRKNLCKEAGGYAGFNIDGKKMMFHRYVLKPQKDLLCDHINRDRLDNRRKNLRYITHRQNRLNRKSKNTTGYIGVSLDSSGKYYYTYYRKKNHKRLQKYSKKTPKNLMLLALLRDKWILTEDEQDYAPMNFPIFKNEPYKSILLAIEIDSFDL